MATEPMPSWLPPEFQVVLDEILQHPRSALSMNYRAEPQIKAILQHLVRDSYPKFVKGMSCGAIATEMCHMTFVTFVKTLVTSCRELEGIQKLLEVAFIQLVNKIMCAQKYFNFRHNDFHNQNAMMTCRPVLGAFSASEM